MPISPRKELLQIQRQLFLRNKRIIEESILLKEPGFDRYEKEYRRNSSKFDCVATIDDLNDAVMRANIVYVGDYHTCNQSQRSFLRILKSVVKKNNKFSIGLELIHTKHQEVLGQYMRGKISEEKFLEKIKLEEHWFYDLWGNFKPLFDFCHYHDIDIFAIDAAPEGSNLRIRDEATAKVIAERLRKDKGKKLFILIGDLHIAPSHLPKDVLNLLSPDEKKKIKDLILYQNSENIYWDLALKGKDAAEVVKINDRSFCRMHTPPVICQRSYLNWLEHEESEIDFSDLKHEFVEITERICQFLKIDLDSRHVDKIEIFTSGDLGFLDRLNELGLDKKEISVVKKQILGSESYYIAKAHIVYLANLSINHAAEEVAHFIKAVCSGAEKPRKIEDAFYANILHEALGFFGSKVINSRRKCFQTDEFCELMKYLDEIGIPADRSLEYETAEFVTEFKNLEEHGRFPKDLSFLMCKLDLFIAVTHAIGYMLGEKIFYGLLENLVSKKDIRDLFFDRWEKEGSARDVYIRIIRKTGKVTIPERM